MGSLAFCVDPEIPKNDGFHRHVQILSPAGTILSAQPPFSTQEATMDAAEMLYRALLRAAAGACPEMAAAGSTLIQFSTYIGIDHRDGRKRLLSCANFNECGGGGGSLGTDGNPCMMEMGVAGGMKFASAEMEEWLYPVGVEQCEIYEDSQGAGHWRDAPGVITRVRGDESGGPIEIHTYSWGHNNLSHGTLGGRPGIGGTVFIRDPENPETRTFYSGFGNFTLPPGWEYVVIASGGGYGDPLERGPDVAGADVRDEIVSVASAEEDYGVVVDSASG